MTTIIKSAKLFSIASLIFSCSLHAQQAAYFDAAQAYNKLLIEKSNGSYTRVGAYKVIGSPYLFGEKRSGDIYSPKDSGSNIQISYNTYSQEVGFFSQAVANVSLVREPGTIDSFIIRADPAQNLLTDIKFIYGSLLGVKDKAYFQVVAPGKRLTLYKKYLAELANVATNYVQSDLRQFNILVDYYYKDSSTGELKKLKTNSRFLVKEFSKWKDISGIIDEDALVVNREMELVKIFMELNKD